jgi:hypothetical protein
VFWELVAAGLMADILKGGWHLALNSVIAFCCVLTD